MKLDALTVRLLILQRLPLSGTVTSGEVDFFALSITKMITQGYKADYIALQLCRIHANVLGQAFAGKSYLDLATELARLAKPET